MSKVTNRLMISLRVEPTKNKQEKRVFLAEDYANW